MAQACDGPPPGAVADPVLARLTPGNAKLALGTTLVLLAAFASGITLLESEDRPEKLWVEQGSRVVEEKEYYDETFGGAPGAAVFMVTADARDGDVLTNEVLAFVEDAMGTIYAARGDDPVLGSVGYEDVCHEPAVPNLVRGIFVPNDARFPCIRPTVLDCFDEGGFDYHLPHTEVIRNYWEQPGKGRLKPSYANMTDSEIKARVSGGCRNFGDFSWPESALLGGIARENDANGTISSVRSLRTSFGIYPERLVVDKVDAIHGEELSTAEAEALINTVSDAILDVLENVVAPNAPAGTSVQYFVDPRSVDLLVRNIGDSDAGLIIGGYVSMFLFTGVALMRWRSAESKALLGLSGVVLIGFAVAAAFGFAGFVGLRLNAASAQVLPFLALGIGLDDEFLLVHTWRPGTERTLAHAIQSITITSCANVIALSMTSLIDLPALQIFAQQALLAVVMMYIAMVGAFVPLMVMEHRAKARGTWQDIWTWSSVSDKGTGTGSDASPVQRWVEQWYAPTLCRPGAGGTLLRCAVVVVFGGFLGVCVWGATSQIELGLDLSDATPAGSSASEFVSVTNEYFKLWPAVVVIRNQDHSLEAAQQAALDLHRDLADAPFFLQNKPELSELSWMLDFRVNILNCHRFFGFFGDPTEIMDAELLPTDLGPDDGVLQDSNELDYIVPSEHYYPYLEVYMASFGVGFATAIPLEERSLQTSHFNVLFDGLTSTQDFLDSIRESRRIVDSSGIDAYIFGVHYLYWEQYQGIEDTAWATIGFVLLALGVTLTVFTRSLVLGAVLITVIGSIVVEVFGMVALVGIKLNGVTLANLVVAAGVSVEFTVHMVVAYQFSRAAGRHARTVEALAEMFEPILLGALTTLLGVVFLAAADYRYLQIYYFGLLTIVVGVASLNGLVLLPTLLALVGSAPPASPPKIAPSSSQEEARAMEAM